MHATRSPRQTRRGFLQSAGLGAAALLSARFLLADESGRTPVVPSGATAGSSGRGGATPAPNVLWLIAEDMCPDLACYGQSLVKTPNLDRLAAEGMRFTNAFTTGAVCSPSRSAFYTGMYQTTIGAQQHRTPSKKPLPDGVKVLSDLFRAGGYFTTNTSFGHHWRAKFDEPERYVTFTREGKTDWNFRVGHNSFDGRDWSQCKPGQPFFASVNFDYTHRPFERDQARPIDPDKVKVPPEYPNTPLARRDWADYLESIQLLDDEVGRVLDRLDHDGLTENTIVMFVGDHGRCQVRGKQWLYDGGIHVPMIIRWPGHIKPGSVNDQLVSGIDWAATSLNLAGLGVPSYMQGRPCLGPGAVEREYIFAARDRSDEAFDRIRCVRTKRYKYIRNFYPEIPYTASNLYKKQHYPEITEMRVLKAQGKLTDAQMHFMSDKRPAEELYDIVADPNEIHNLAGDPAHANTLEKLRTELEKWVKDTKDMGETRENPAIAAKEAKHMYGIWVRTCESRDLPVDISDENYLAWWKLHMLDEDGPGFKSIFNGKDLTGWDAKPGWWRVENGAITSETTREKPLKKPNYIIWQGGEPGDFELRLNVRLIGGNSGIQFRSQRRPDWDTYGYQADLDAENKWTGCLYEHARGKVGGIGEKTVIDKAGKKTITKIGSKDRILRLFYQNGWNSYRIIAKGPEITLLINDVVTCRVVDNQESGKAKAAPKGVIGLQVHPGPPMKVQFKDIRIKTFD